MTEYKCNVPILLIVFNRLDTTIHVLEKIKRVRPKKIYIAADGPRDDAEAAACTLVIEYIIQNIDWDTELFTLIREENLGCRLNVSNAISWFFSNEEFGIILEDDCLPAESFFPFCEALLTKYKDNPQIMHISGTNMQDGKIIGNASYYFSAISHVWGWASWRRAWLNYDLELEDLRAFIRQKYINTIFDSLSARINFIRVLLQIKRSRHASTWDFQWTYSIIKSNGICITPNNNLISNIGFGQNSTHSWDADSKFANLPVKELEGIVHPEHITISKEADFYEGETIYRLPTITYIVRKLFHRIRNILATK